MKVEEIETSRIIPYANNPRHNDQAVSAVAASIKEFGFRQPIVTDETMPILVGHTRLKAAQNLGLSVVPVHVAEGLTEAQKKAYRIADNRLNELAEWDNELLSLELEALIKADFDIGLLGFSDDELDELLDDSTGTEGNTDPDEVPEVPENPVTKLGDVWVLGEHRLMCGDSTSTQDRAVLVRGKIDFVFTDPPYGVRVEMDNKGTVCPEKILGDETTEVACAALFSCLQLGVPLLFWGANHYCRDAELPNSSCWVVWDKQEANNHIDQADCELAWTNIKGPARVFRHLWMGFRRDSEVGETRVHPTQKPYALIEEIFSLFRVGKVVLDLFGGSGSTLIACEKTARVSLVMELDPKYCDVIIKRWQDFTGKKATLERTGEEFDTLRASISEETVIK